MALLVVSYDGVCSKIIFNTAWSNADPVPHRLWNKVMALLQELLQGFQGPSVTRARTKTDSFTSQQSPCPRKRSLWKRRSREKKWFPCLRLHCRAKEGFPLPGPFSAGHSARRKGFSIDKQLTNSGHLMTVNQLQEMLKMKNSQGGQEQETLLLWPESQAMQAGEKQSNNCSH